MEAGGWGGGLTRGMRLEASREQLVTPAALKRGGGYEKTCFFTEKKAPAADSLVEANL